MLSVIALSLVPVGFAVGFSEQIPASALWDACQKREPICQKLVHDAIRDWPMYVLSPTDFGIHQQVCPTGTDVYDDKIPDIIIQNWNQPTWLPNFTAAEAARVAMATRFPTCVENPADT